MLAGAKDCSRGLYKTGWYLSGFRIQTSFSPGSIGAMCGHARAPLTAQNPAS